jgi:hypothetical protein
MKIPVDRFQPCEQVTGRAGQRRMSIVLASMLAAYVGSLIPSALAASAADAAGNAFIAVSTQLPLWSSRKLGG